MVLINCLIVTNTDRNWCKERNVKSRSYLYSQEHTMRYVLYIDKVHSNIIQGISKSLILPASVLGPSRTITGSDHIQSFILYMETPENPHSLFSISQKGCGDHNYLNGDLEISLVSLAGPVSDPISCGLVLSKVLCPNQLFGITLKLLEMKILTPHPNLMNQNVWLGEGRETRILKYVKVWHAFGIKTAFSALRSSFNKYLLCAKHFSENWTFTHKQVRRALLLQNRANFSNEEKY